MTTTAEDLVLEKGRGYLYRSRYPQVVVFTNSGTELDKLVQAFGGNTYRHGTGHVWILSKKKDILVMIDKIKPFLPSRNHFEDIFDVQRET